MKSNTGTLSFIHIFRKKNEKLEGMKENKTRFLVSQHVLGLKGHKNTKKSPISATRWVLFWISWSQRLLLCIRLITCPAVANNEQSQNKTFAYSLFLKQLLLASQFPLLHRTAFVTSRPYFLFACSWNFPALLAWRPLRQQVTTKPEKLERLRDSPVRIHVVKNIMLVASATDDSGIFAETAFKASFYTSRFK